jgi:nucleoside-diphosphate-sugar epimerase
MAIESQKTSIRNVAELDELLSEPTEATIRALAELEGDLLILGVGGKMGPTLARMAKRASEKAGIRRRVIGVSRFSSRECEEQLQAWGVETIRCDLLDRKSLFELPEAANIIYMAGMKFGCTGQESLTWAMNSFLPGLVCERYPDSTIAAFSTGNVYGLCPVSKKGSRESDPLNPLGEYAMSCLGRERIFEHFSRASKMNITILRLNYASEMRYGVLLDVAKRVYAEQAVPLSIGYLNAIWQGDASAMSLQALGHASTPSFVINIAGPELLSVRSIAEEFGALFQKPVHFEGVESDDALLSDAGRAFDLFGHPRISAAQVIRWIADWIARGQATSTKPTHFEERAGRF